MCLCIISSTGIIHGGSGGGLGGQVITRIMQNPTDNNATSRILSRGAPSVFV